MIAELRRSLVRVLRKLAFDVASVDAAFWQQRVEPGQHAARSFLNAARALQREQQLAEADEVLARAAGAFTADRDILIAAAMSAHDAAHYHDAIARWEAAMAIAADHPMCHAGLSANLRETGQFARASTLISAALDRFPGNLLVITEAARVASARGADDDALTLWALAAQTSDAHPEWLREYAHALWRSKQSDAARAALNDARQKHPDDLALQQLEAQFETASDR